MKSINPSTNEVIATFSHLSKEETMNAVVAADDAFESWSKSKFGKREIIVKKFANILRDHSKELAELITTEMGKRISESQYEIEYCANICEFYANNAEEFLSDTPLEVEGAKAYIQYTPLGVILGVMPWNFPFYQVIRFAIPNIMAGNTILLKHAGNVPRCATRIEELFREAGLPEGVFTTLLIPSEFVEPILSHEAVRGVSLTGSEKAGAAVASIAGKNIKRSVLELGGNDPFIVLEDADLQEVVEKAVKGRMVNTGQSCVSAKRFIVVEPLAKKFISGLKKAMAKLKIGDPLDEETDVGPLSSESAAERLEHQVTSSVRAGAKLILGGDRPKREGAYYNPTILTQVSEDNPTFDQELFGPVATVHVVKDEEEAIKLANNSSYGLGASVHTKDLDRAHQVARKIESGMVFINRSTKSQADLPFGGIKNSGYGRELSKQGIMEFVNKKLINELIEEKD